MQITNQKTPHHQHHRVTYPIQAVTTSPQVYSTLICSVFDHKLLLVRWWGEQDQPSPSEAVCEKGI